MGQPLALKYRPKTFDDMVGQRHIKPILKQMVASGNLPPALLLAGSRGTGKTTSGRILAAALNCQSEHTRPCGSCANCMSAFGANSTDVIEIDAASNGLVNDIRKLKEVVMYATSGQWRVVLLDEAHSMSKEAFNALLKVLEEPPPNTVFVLLTTEPHKILETVVSRSMVFEFRRISPQDIKLRLRHIADAEGIEADDEMLDEIVGRVQGGMRDAVMLLDQMSRVGVTDAAGFREMHGIYNAALPILEALRSANLDKAFTLLDEYFERSGDSAALVRELVGELSSQLRAASAGEPAVAPVDRLIASMRVLWDLKQRTRFVDNDQRAAMEMAVALLSEALQPKAPTNGTPTPQAKKLDLASMQAMAAGGKVPAGGAS